MANSNDARQLATRIAMMPRDTNGAGHIFGGVLLSDIDIAGAIVARGACGGLVNRVVTRAMDKVEFKKPVLVNDILTCYGTITRVGRTSVSVHVDVEVDRAGEIIEVTEADVVYVAVDEDGKPARIPCGDAAPAARRVPAADPPENLDPKNRVLALRKAMMPNEINGMGNIFGGVLLSYMDLAGSYAARRVCASNYIHRCVTRLMDRVEFKQPVHVNDVISCYGTVTRIGNTSVNVHVEVEALRNGEIIPVTSADLIFVALDEEGMPTSVLCSTAARPPRRRVLRGMWRRVVRAVRAFCAN